MPEPPAVEDEDSQADEAEDETEQEDSADGT
jgi:hypothetical protein